MRLPLGGISHGLPNYPFVSWWILARNGFLPKPRIHSLIMILCLARMKLGGIAFALITSFFGFGCSSIPELREERLASTGISSNEAIAVLLSTYSYGKGPAYQEHMDLLGIERSFDSCLRREMQASRNGLEFIAPQTLREAGFPGRSIEQIPT